MEKCANRCGDPAGDRVCRIQENLRARIGDTDLVHEKREVVRDDIVTRYGSLLAPEFNDRKELCLQTCPNQLNAKFSAVR